MLHACFEQSALVTEPLQRNPDTEYDCYGFECTEQQRIVGSHTDASRIHCERDEFHRRRRYRQGTEVKATPCAVAVPIPEIRIALHFLSWEYPPSTQGGGDPCHVSRIQESCDAVSFRRTGHRQQYKAARRPHSNDFMFFCQSRIPSK